MTHTYVETSQNANSENGWPRDQVASNIIEFDSHEGNLSQREFCRQKQIPRSTFQGWCDRKDKIGGNTAVVDFFESPEGTEFMHLLVHSLHFHFTKTGCASIRNICNFIEDTQLSRFVAASYGYHQNLSDHMDQMIGNFGDMEKARLSENMPEKSITVCEDETFNPKICLVAMEPRSNFIFLEKYADDRTGETWNKELSNALLGLPVNVIQGTSDEAKGLINHITKGFNAHHSPDLFHVMQEISRGTGAPLSAVIRKLVCELERKEMALAKANKKKREIANLEKRPVGRPIDYGKRVEKCQKEKEEAQESLDSAIKNREVVTNARKDISRKYHPYDPLTGEKQDASVVASHLKESFGKIENSIQSLPDRCKKRVEKARRVTEKMSVTIAFFFCAIETLVNGMNLSNEKHKLMHSHLIPGFYLQNAALKEKDLDQRELIKERSQALLSVLYERNGPLSDFDSYEISRMEKIARECAGIFQRSSSCVEGRNAQLSLHHHGLHRLSDRKMKALTVIHNYYLKRGDGTTAAERFFENKPANLFEWLLVQMPLPSRPRSRIKLAA